MMRSELIGYLDSYLAINAFSDGIWNGLQVEGKQEINKLVFAVDAGVETFEKAIEAGGDMIIVHHGHFFRGANPSFTGWAKKRLSLLMNNNISLYAAHLPLDAHPEIGNNVQLHKLLGSIPQEPFAFFGGKSISWVGEFVEPKSIGDIEHMLCQELSTTCKVLPFGPKEIKRVAICSGGGGYKLLAQAVDAGVDLYLSGDSIEAYHTAKDAGIHVIFAGHYATETVGIKALAQHVGAKFDVEYQFIDVTTGL